MKTNVTKMAPEAGKKPRRSAQYVKTKHHPYFDELLAQSDTKADACRAIGRSTTYAHDALNDPDGIALVSELAAMGIMLSRRGYVIDLTGEAQEELPLDVADVKEGARDSDGTRLVMFAENGDRLDKLMRMAEMKGVVAERHEGVVMFDGDGVDELLGVARFMRLDFEEA